MEKDIRPGYCPEMEKEHASEEDYIFGGETKIVSEVLQEDGQWDEFLPPLEVQKNVFMDSYACVSYANNNAIETLHKRIYGEETDRSDRFTAKMSGTIPGRGNSLKAVADSQRVNGTVLEELYPFTDNMKAGEYYQEVPTDIKNAGLQWAVAVEYLYEWVKKDHNEWMKALKYSPLPTAVDSHTNRASQFNAYDHSVLLVGYKKNEYWKVFDSYLNRYKTYDWNYPFYSPLKIHYKRILNIILEDMKMELLRNKDTGAIFLMDSDQVLHYIEAPTDFKEFIGQKAWDEKAWKDLEPEQIAVYKVGMNISAKKTGMAEALIRLFKNFGKNKS